MTHVPDEHLLCARCDYDLMTLSEDARCPECGFPVDDSMRVGGTWSFARLRRLRSAALAFLVATIAWTIFALTLGAAGSPTPLARSLIAVDLAVHAVALTTAALLATAAGSRRPKRSRIRAMLFLSTLVAVAAAGVILLVLRVSPLSGLGPELVLPVATLLRATLIAATAWWLMQSLWAITDAGKFPAFIAIALTALSVSCWCIFAAKFALAGGASAALDFGRAALIVDVIASLVTAAVALALLPAIASRTAQR